VIPVKMMVNNAADAHDSYTSAIAMVLPPRTTTPSVGWIRLLKTCAVVESQNQPVRSQPR
jgi:hypothetical protein